MKKWKLKLSVKCLVEGDMRLRGLSKIFVSDDPDDLNLEIIFLLSIAFKVTLTINYEPVLVFFNVRAWRQKYPDNFRFLIMYKFNHSRLQLND